MTGYDELFMNDQERADIRKPKVEEIPLTELTPFKDHPFKVKNDEEMAELMKSIADSGVLAPALARPKDGGGYELISGHRRLAACKALGMETMPVIIRDTLYYRLEGYTYEKSRMLYLYESLHCYAGGRIQFGRTEVQAPQVC